MNTSKLNMSELIVRLRQSSSTFLLRIAKQLLLLNVDEEKPEAAELFRRIYMRRKLYKEWIANAIRQHYGNEFKPKIIWAYITNNIIWSDADMERAATINVKVVTKMKCNILMHLSNTWDQLEDISFLLSSRKPGNTRSFEYQNSCNQRQAWG